MRRSSGGYDGTIRASSGAGRPLLPTATRDLSPLCEAVRSWVHENIEAEYHHRLDELPPVAWSRRVVDSYFGVWSYRRYGKGAGRARIRVNRLLNTRSAIVDDAVLEFIIFHEYLHHLLPFRGHDAEFRRLEAKWPDVDRIEALLDTLGDEYDLTASRYWRRGTAS